MNVQEIIDRLVSCLEPGPATAVAIYINPTEAAALLAHIRSRESIIEQQKNTIRGLIGGMPGHVPTTATELARYIGNIEAALAALKRPAEGEDAMDGLLHTLIDEVIAVERYGGTRNVVARQTTHDNILSLYRSALRDALRYQWLRGRDLDTIATGGVFAGQTPENIVVNGEDLDSIIDSAMEKSNG